MDFDRNRYFMFGVLVLLLGMQFRMIESFTLNEPTTRALHRVARSSELSQADFGRDVYMKVGKPRKTIQPPEWIGWAMLTVGGVIFLHAMVLPKSDS